MRAEPGVRTGAAIRDNRFFCLTSVYPRARTENTNMGARTHWTPQTTSRPSSMYSGPNFPNFSHVSGGSGIVRTANTHTPHTEAMRCHKSMSKLSHRPGPTFLSHRLLSLSPPTPKQRR